MTSRVLFLVPARGGSRRVPGKNLRLVAGIPLVGHAARTARAAAARLGGGPHRVICSTDDPAIAAAAEAWGAEVLRRPDRLATDTATSTDVALHALDELEATSGPFATLVLLQPSSPLTDPMDVIDAVESHRAHRGVSVTSVVTSHPASWHHDRFPDGTLDAATAARSDDVLLTGAFYVVAPADLRRARGFVELGRTLGRLVSPERAVDIDEEHDLVVAEAMAGARQAPAFPLGERQIGRRPVFVIAEAGVNHNGDPELAGRLVDAAAAVGADAVKFQTFDPDALAASGAPTAAYQRRAGVAATDQREMLARLALPTEAWADLAARAQSRGLVFLSTPFDEGSADLLADLGVPAFKVGSGELTNTPFIARLALRGRPLLISTGMADMIEVAAAVDAVRAVADVPVALFHCVSAYPAEPADANLHAIETMRRAFACPVGWSDHTAGTKLALAAVALGATLVEKHLTLDRGMAGPDHRASLEPDAFRSMLTGIRAVEAALGSGEKVPAESELDVARVARRSLHWHASYPIGHVVRPADFDARRPGTGLSPARAEMLVGSRTARVVEAGRLVDPADLESAP
jgi:sialic acid synthase SpsE/CMP-N-acetylneuraminic acid synthetase